MDDLEMGDKVTHFSQPGKVGELVSVSRDGYTRELIYNVAWPWSEGSTTPYRRHLVKVEGGAE